MLSFNKNLIKIKIFLKQFAGPAIWQRMKGCDGNGPLGSSTPKVEKLSQ